MKRNNSRLGITYANVMISFKIHTPNNILSYCLHYASGHKTRSILITPWICCAKSLTAHPIGDLCGLAHHNNS